MTFLGMRAFYINSIYKEVTSHCKQFSKSKIYLCILWNICFLFSFTFNAPFLFFRVCHSFCGRGTRTTPHYKCISFCLYVHFLSVFLRWCSWWCVMCNLIRDRIRGERLQHFSNACAEITHAQKRTICWFMQWYGGFLNTKLEKSHAMLPICSTRRTYAYICVLRSYGNFPRYPRHILISRIIYEAKLGISVLFCLSRSFAFTPSWSCWWIWSVMSRLLMDRPHTYTNIHTILILFLIALFALMLADVMTCCSFPKFPLRPLSFPQLKHLASR